MGTRFYFPYGTAAAVEPALHASWTFTTGHSHRKLAYPKGSTTVTTGNTISFTAGTVALDTQFVSDPLSAGIEFSTSVTVKGYLRVAEIATADNVDRIMLAIAIYSEDGTTLRRQLLAPASYGTTNEFTKSTVNFTNRIIANGDALAPASSYTTVDGDRLVVEIGYADSGASPEGLAKWGESESDVGENVTDTTGSGWIEFSNTITFRQVPFYDTRIYCNDLPPTKKIPGIAFFAPSFFFVSLVPMLSCGGPPSSEAYQPFKPGRWQYQSYAAPISPPQNSYSYSGVGGGVGGGEATTSRFFVRTISGNGGGIGGGACDTSRFFIVTIVGSGGGVGGGSATITPTYTYSYTGVGGGVAGGAATVTPNFNASFTGAGGAVAGGEATITPNRNASFTGDGGAVGGGACDTSRFFVLTVVGAGGGVGGGSATISQEYAGAITIEKYWQQPSEPVRTKPVLKELPSFFFPVPRNISSSISGSGGGVGGGSATTSRFFVLTITGSGGGIGGGAATTSRFFINYYTGTGGAVAGGAAIITPNRNASFTGSGGAVAGGSATVTQTHTYSHTGFGGGVAGGSATITPTHTYSYTGSGGAVAGGSATVQQQYFGAVNIAQWYQPLSEPVLPKKRCIEIPSVFYVDRLLIDEQYYQPFIGRWQYQTIAEVISWCVTYYGSGGAVAGGSASIQIIPCEYSYQAYTGRWQYPSWVSQPLKFGIPSPPPPEEEQPFHWYVPIVQPIFPKPRPVIDTHRPMAAVEETVETVSNWQQPLSQPIFRAKRVIYDLPAFVWVPPEGPITLDKWYRPASEPTPRKPKLPVGAYFYTCFVWVPPEGPITLDKWYRPVSEPVRVGPKLPTGVHESVWVWVPPEGPVTLDKWYQPLSEPVRIPPRVLPQDWAPKRTWEEPQPLTMDRWYVPIVDPTRAKPSLYYSEPFFYVKKIILPTYGRKGNPIFLIGLS